MDSETTWMFEVEGTPGDPWTSLQVIGPKFWLNKKTPKEWGNP